MFSQNGLSLDQAPPINVVYRFFFMGALFGILSGISLFIFKTNIFDASSSGAIIFTHLLTLGVMLNFMFAALFQMLPVIAGVKLSFPQHRAKLLLYPLTLGILSLLLAFSQPHYSWAYLLAAFLLAFALFGAIAPMLYKLLTLQHHSASSRGMSFALSSLLLTLLFALYLLLSLSGTLQGEYYLEIKTAHYSFGLFGWVSLLILSISFQVIEMFYVTPSYPPLMQKHLPLALFALLLGSSVVSFFIPSLWTFTHLILIALLGLYALLTLKRLTQRKRPLTDATVWFWRLGLSSLLVSLFAFLLMSVPYFAFLKPIAYLFFVSFALSIVFAMFYKIIPFLTWFHLNAQGYFTAPMMHEVIHPKTAKKHLYIHVATIVTFLLSLYAPHFIYLAALLTILSFSWIAWQIIHASKLYKETQKNGEKFDMGSMG